MVATARSGSADVTAGRSRKLDRATSEAARSSRAAARGARPSDTRPSDTQSRRHCALGHPPASRLVRCSQSFAESRRGARARPTHPTTATTARAHLGLYSDIPCDPYFFCSSPPASRPPPRTSTGLVPACRTASASLKQTATPMIGAGSSGTSTATWWTEGCPRRCRSTGAGRGRARMIGVSEARTGVWRG